MPGATTVRLIIICTDAARAIVNDTLRNVDPTSVGDPVTVPLRMAGDMTNVTVAWAASWAMEDVTSQAFRAAVRDAGWRPKPTTAEQTVYGAGQTVPAFNSGQRVWLWDGYVVPFNDCLTALGVDRFYYPPRG